MNQNERNQLYAVLMDQWPQLNDPSEVQEVVEILHADVDAIERVIDPMLQQAEARGRFAAWLEICHANLARTSRSN